MPNQPQQHDRLHYESLPFLIWTAHRMMTVELRETLAQEDVSVGAWRILRVLCAEDGISQKELAQRTGTTAAMTAGLVEGMERDGLLRRERSSSDRRSYQVFATEQTHELKAKLLPRVDAAMHHALQRLDPRQIDTLREGMLTIIGNYAAE